jgi:DNA replication protein DnaC
MMDRTEILNTMGALKLFGMKAGYDEIIATAVKRQHEPQRIVGDLLAAEMSEKQARSIKYQMTIARMPFAKEIEEFAFEDTPVNEILVRDLAGGAFLEQQRNLVLIGGTGTGKTHLAVGIVRACIRSGARGALPRMKRDRRVFCCDRGATRDWGRSRVARRWRGGSAWRLGQR